MITGSVCWFISLFTFNLAEMKTLTILLLCCQTCWCLGTLVVDLEQSSNENKNTFLDLDTGIEIINPLTFCLRFNIKGILASNYIFSGKDDNLVLTLRFTIGIGICVINSVGFVFEIPKENDVIPFHWHHICVSSNNHSYTIVFDGQQWYHANHTLPSSEKKTLEKFYLGSPNEHWVHSDGINFRGLLSELNIWNKSLSFFQMVEITVNCGKIEPSPDLLDWSKVLSSNIRGSKYNESIENICSQRNTTSLVYKIMPHLHNQDNAIQVCEILNGELSFPNSLNELQTWNGK